MENNTFIHGWVMFELWLPTPSILLLYPSLLPSITLGSDSGRDPGEMTSYDHCRYFLLLYCGGVVELLRERKM